MINPRPVLSVEWLEDPSADNLVEVASLLNDFWREIIPDEPDVPPDEWAALCRTAEHRRIRVAVVRDGSETVGAGVLGIDDVEGRRDICRVVELSVRSDRRRQGVGTTLLHELTEKARREGRSRLDFEVPKAHRAGVAFAEKIGAAPGLVDEQNRVRVAEIDMTLLERWVKEAETRATAYSLVGFDDVCPDDLLDRFSSLCLVMNTAPRTEGIEEMLLTPEQIRANQEAHLARGGWRWTVCARHDESGELVGFTELGGSGFRPWIAEQDDTAVSIPHRNQGLGRWIKAVNALRLVQERPEVTVIETWNAGVNAPMLSINHAMGYRCVAQWQEWILEI